MNRLDEDLWMKKMRSSLEEYSESPPAGGWDRLQDELLITPSVEKRIYSYRTWTSVAAVLILAISAVSFYFLNSPVADEIRNTSVSSLVTDPDVMPVIREPEAVLAVTTKPVINKMPVRLADRPVHRAIDNEAVTDEINPVPEENVSSKETENDKEIVEEIEENIEPKETRQVVKPSSREKLHLPVDDDRREEKRKKGWSVGLSVNSSSVSSSSSSSPLGNIQNQFIDVDMDVAQNGAIVNLPKESVVFFSNGLPYYKRLSEDDYSHSQPITFGLSVRKGLSHHLSLETGLTYTLLNSKVKSLDKKQQLHYVGIPLRVNWDFIHTKNFTVYVGAGGAAEKCVYGKYDGEKQSVKELQFSLNGAVGAQYNLSRQVGLYLEPGVSYYFDDGSGVQTIRKETPFNFNFQAGIRFSY